MAWPKCPMRDFTNLNRIYKAHWANVWWAMKVFRLQCDLVPDRHKAITVPEPIIIYGLSCRNQVQWNLNQNTKVSFLRKRISKYCLQNSGWFGQTSVCVCDILLFRFQGGSLLPAPSGYAPSLSWQKKQIADFSLVRQQFSQHLTEMKKTKQEKLTIKIVSSAAYIDCFVQNGHNSSALAMELCLFCINTLRLRRNKHYFQMHFLKWKCIQSSKFQHWFRQWLGAHQATSHCLNQ